MRSSLLAFAAVSCLALSSGVHAADSYIFPNFVAAGAGVQANPEVKGAALLVYNADLGTTHVHLALRDLEPNTEYGIKFSVGDNSSSNPQAFTTDSNGRIGYTQDVALPLVKDPFGPLPSFLVYRWDGETGEFWELIEQVTDEELRACGIMMRF
jgi:hypothetical protein